MKYTYYKTDGLLARANADEDILGVDFVEILNDTEWTKYEDLSEFVHNSREVDLETAKKLHFRESGKELEDVEFVDEQEDRTK